MDQAAALDPQNLLEAATNAAGLDDFGPASFREGLDVYCASLTSQAQLNALGMAALPSLITNNLTRRLRVIDWAKKHPQVQDETIEAPIVVVGLFRAGTTLLELPARSGSRQPFTARLGVRRPGASSGARRAPQRTTRRGGQGPSGHGRRAQSEARRHASRRA